MATPVRIDEQMDARIQRLANFRKRSPESMVSEAIAQYVAREEDQVSFVEEAEASWKSYQETGLHLNSRETHAWLGNWGADGDEAAPKCHD